MLVVNRCFEYLSLQMTLLKITTCEEITSILLPKNQMDWIFYCPKIKWNVGFHEFRASPKACPSLPLPLRGGCC